MKKLLVLLVAVLLVVCGCSRDESPVAGPKPQPTGPDESVVVSNCAVLRAAVEQFALENLGNYPSNVDTDTTLEGHTLLELLPGGQLPENPFTKEPTVPVNGVAAHPGEIGYAPIAESDLNVGYIITGFGAQALIAQLSNVGSPEDAKVIANCLIVQKAAEDYRVKYHTSQYPSDDEVTYRYSWFVYRMGIHLTDPFTGLPRGVTCGTASSPGEIGYVALYRNGDPIGYVITGYGSHSIVAAVSSLGCSREEAIIVSDCRTLQNAVNDKAERSGSLFPDNIGAFQASVGTSVMNGFAIEDRRSKYAIQTPSGAAALGAPGPGRIVYEVIRREGWNIGYRIAGYAGDMKLIELTNLDPQENAVVRLNALRLKAAVEAFVARSGGHYPENVDEDMTPDGKRVIDLLPRGELLLNPYTGKWVPPANYTASSAGEIGYAVVHRVIPQPGSESLDPGYVITGHGKYVMEVVVTNLNFSAKEAQVLSNCRTVQLAADKFAELNGGIYPSDVGTDMTPDGRTITTMLPGAVLLMNPFWFIMCEPVDGSAAQRGQTGYVPVCQYGENRGYVITGVGKDDGTVIITIVHEP